MFISSVIFSGGEPTIQSTILEKLAIFVKSRKLLVGIQTNGYYPDRLKNLADKNLIDKIFLDVKASPSDEYIYEEVTQVKDASNKIRETLNLLLNFKTLVEIRTTIFRSINHTEKIVKYLSDNNLNFEYVIQQGIPWNCLAENLRKENILTRKEMIETGKKLQFKKIKIKTKEGGEEVIYH